MKDRDFAAAKKRVWKYIQKWQDRLWVSGYNCIHEWLDEPILPEIAPPPGYEIRSIAARTIVTPEYFLVTFKWHLPTIAELPDRDAEATVIHEMLHVTLAELHVCRDASDVEWHEERVATALTRMVYSLAYNPFPKEKALAAPKEKPE